MERGSISSRKRRSSILKLGFNRDDDTNTTGFIFNKSQGQSRRVSFAATAEVKEFPRDSPRVWRRDSEEDSEKENVPQQNRAGGVSITGLDSLINGQIDPQSYQSITECPIPEMSSDSFNLCLGNETVRETLDMETTQCVEPAEFDWPRFQSEPSAEIKITESSFLASLKRQTKCLSPLQIYRSPKDRQQRSESGPDYPDNESPIRMALQLNETACQQTDSPQYKPVDSKSFLNGLLGSKSIGFNHLDNFDMDESLCNDGLPHSDKTVYFTEADTLNGMELTHCLGAVLNNSQFGQSLKNVDMDVSLCSEDPLKSDRTVHFTEADRFGGMEETLCHGAILNNTQLGQSLRARTNSNLERDITGTLNSNKTLIGDNFQGLEETACIGGILSNADKENMVPKSFNSSQLSQFCGNERTRYFGENAPVEMMEETRSVGAILNSDLTSQITANNTLMNMREVDRTKYFEDQEDCMEGTRCVGGNIQETTPTTLDKSVLKHVDKTIHFSSNISGNVVEETACIGGILKNNAVTRNDLNFLGEHVQPTRNDSNRTIYFNENQESFAIDETKCEGGILLNASQSEKLNKSQQRRSLCSYGDKTKYFTDTTINVEETKCLGSIEIETNGKIDMTEKDANRTRHFCKNSDQAGIEETQCINATIHVGITAASDQWKEDGIRRISPLKEGVTDPNKTKYFGANSELAGIEETRCEDATIHLCNTTTSVQGKGGDGIVGLEDDKLDKSCSSSDKQGINIDVTSEKPLHKTVIASVSMEETNIGGGILTDDISIVEEPLLKQRYENTEKKRDSMNKSDKQKNLEGEENATEKEDSDFVNDKTESNKIDVNATSCSSHSSSGKNNMAIDNPKEQVCPDITDTEITFKTTNKRTLSDLKSKDTEPDRTRDLTRDLTQTDSYTKKIKEMLMMSAQKTAPQIKAGMIKTPSKSLTGVTTGSGQATGTSSASSSPAHKRIRLFDLQSDNTAGKTNDLGTKPVEGLIDTDMELGIDEETMPDGMSHIAAINDTCNETANQHNTTRGTSDSGTTSTQSLSNTSIFSNRSLIISRAPDGPMTLDTFFKLTCIPTYGYKIAGRCSILVPKKRIDCLDEKLETEIVDRLLVEEKKKMYEKVTDKLQRNEDNLEWLRKTIEETQPQIFQDVAKGNREEVNGISEELFSMYKCCSKEGSVMWKRERTKMFEEAIARIETEGVQKAESLLETVRSQNEETEKLLTDIDKEMEELERSQLLLVELEERKKKLERDLKEACKNIERDSVLEKELKKNVEENQQNRKLQEQRTSLRLKIGQQLFLVGWNLEDVNEDWIGFTFLEEEFLLTVYLKKDSTTSTIQGIEMESRLQPDCPWLHKKIAHSLLLKAIDRQYLLQKYNDYSSLPKMLNEISSKVFEIIRICKEVEEIKCSHKLSWDDQMLSFELWNLKTLRMVKVSMNLHSQLTSTASGCDVDVKRQLGNISSEEIQSSLTSVTSGYRYLHRIIQAVELKLAEIKIND